MPSGLECPWMSLLLNLQISSYFTTFEPNFRLAYDITSLANSS